MRYFFHLSADSGTSDEQGIELASFEAAKTEAYRYLSDTLRDYAEALPLEDELRLTVCDAGGVTLLAYTLCMTEPMPIEANIHAVERTLATV